MACLNVILVISSLILASHGLFVNNKASENQITSPVEQYPAGSAPGSPENLQLLDDIFGTTPTTSEFLPHNSTLESNASLKSVTSPLEHYPAGSAPGSPEDLQLLNDIFGTTPTTSEFLPRNSTLESNASLKSVASPLQLYPAGSTPESPEDLRILNDIFGTTTASELPSTRLKLKPSAVGDVDEPTEKGQLPGSSDHAMPTVSKRFGSIDANTNLDNGKETVPITRSLPNTDTLTGGGSVSSPKSNENEIPDQLENDPTPLLDDKLKERLSGLFIQNAPVEYKNNEEDLNTTHTGGGKTHGQRIGIISSPPNYENQFVNYDFDVIYDDEPSVVKNEEAEELDIDSLARAADPSNKVEIAYDIGDADYVPPSLLGPTTNDTKVEEYSNIGDADYIPPFLLGPITNSTPPSLSGPTTNDTVTPTTPSPPVTTIEKDEEYSDIGAADYIPPHLLGPTSNNTDVTPKVPNRIHVASTEAHQDETTTIPGASSTETTDSNEYGHTVPLLDDDDNDPEIECKQKLPPINRAGRRVSNIKCEEHMNHLMYGIIDTNECLRLKGYSQVIGGTLSKEGDFPHMGAVGWSLKNNSWVYLCGSSLISSRFSLTAGHCKAVRQSRGQFADISDLNPKVVRFGSVYLANNEGAIIMNIEEFIVTEEYGKNVHSKYNDIGLIKFNKDVPISQFLRPACLWDGYLRGHLTGNVTGWGQTKSDQLDSKSQHLQHAEIDYFSKDECFKMLDHRKSRQWKEGLIDSQFCAGKLTGYVDTCQGDSGGPNQVQEPLPMHSNVPMYYVVGITSFGIKCGEPNTPGVYTNVTQYLCWIEKTVWPDEENQLCP